jgi:hypothetical protein
MGFHLGKLEGDADLGFVIVLNQEIAIEPGKLGNATYIRNLARAISMANQGKAPTGTRRTVLPSENVEGFLQLAQPQGMTATRLRDISHVHGSPPFSRTTKARDRFVRFNAFKRDRRVLPGRSIAAGTFATSESDATAVPNAFCAVGRYALPNPVPPVHRFEITTHKGASILAGTCVPLFGQAGGGAEVEFTTALPPGSVVYSGTIAEL